MLITITLIVLKLRVVMLNIICTNKSYAECRGVFRRKNVSIK
jgi:hypothetical protein